jgi:hypothetical protein
MEWWDDGDIDGMAVLGKHEDINGGRIFGLKGLLLRHTQ